MPAPFTPNKYLYQIDTAKAPRNGAFGLPKMRHLTGYVDLKFIGPPVPVLFETRPITGPKTCGVEASVFRLGVENLGSGEVALDHREVEISRITIVVEIAQPERCASFEH